MAFLHVDGPVRCRRRDQQIYLPAKKRRYLQHITYASDQPALVRFVNVGGDRQSRCCFFDAAKNFQAAIHSGTAK